MYPHFSDTTDTNLRAQYIVFGRDQANVYVDLPARGVAYYDFSLCLFDLVLFSMFFATSMRGAQEIRHVIAASSEFIALDTTFYVRVLAFAFVCERQMWRSLCNDVLRPLQCFRLLFVGMFHPSHS